MSKLNILKESLLSSVNSSSESLESIGIGLKNFFEKAVPNLPNFGLDVLLSIGFITLFLEIISYLENTLEGFLFHFA